MDDKRKKKVAPLTPVRDVAREKGGKSLLAVVDPGVFFCVREAGAEIFFFLL